MSRSEQFTINIQIGSAHPGRVIDFPPAISPGFIDATAPSLTSHKDRGRRVELGELPVITPDRGSEDSPPKNSPHSTEQNLSASST